MDNWKKYITENEDKLSIEEVDEKIWENVYKAAVPKRTSFLKDATNAFAGWFKGFGFKAKEESGKRRNHKYRLAYALVFFALVTSSFAFKVRSNSKYGDLVTFSLAKEAYQLNHDTYVKSIFNSFSNVTNPRDPGSFVFIKCIREDNETKKVISNLKVEDGISNLVVTPILFEVRESLFSAFLNKALDIQINEMKPDDKQIRNKLKDLLNERGLNSVDIQIDDNNETIKFTYKDVNQNQPVINNIDSIVIPNEITEGVQLANKTDTIPSKPATKDSSVDGSKSNLTGWKKDLALMTELTKALDKDELVNNKKPYKLEVKDGELYINGEKQTKQISDKYRRFYKNDNYTINNDGDEATSTANHNEKDKPKSASTYPGTNIPKFDPVQYKKELKLMNLLIDGLHNDGLIDRHKPYAVYIKEGDLYIDNKKQTKEVSDKFRQFFSGDNYGFQKGKEKN
jgi:hypothetical protein